MNTRIPIVVPGLGTLSLELPAFTVGYALKSLEDGSIAVIAAMKTPRDASFAKAFIRAERSFPGLAWQKTAAFTNGLSDTGSARPFWGGRVVPTTHGGVKLVVKKDDPILEAYRSLSDRDPVHGAGTDDLVSLLAVLDIDPSMAEEFQGRELSSGEDLPEYEQSTEPEPL